MAWESIVRPPKIGENDILGLLSMQNNALDRIQGGMQGGVNQYSSIIEQRAKNNALKELINDMDSFDRTRGLGEQQNALMQLVGDKFRGDARMSAAEQLGLTNALLDPSIKQKDFDLQDRELGIKDTSNALKLLGLQQDYSLAKEKMNQAQQQAMKPKYEKVTTRDGLGREETKLVPTVNGKVVGEGEVIAKKSPVLNQDDKAFLDDFSQSDLQLNVLEDTLQPTPEGVEDKYSIWGFLNAPASWIGAKFGSPEGQEYEKVAQQLSNMQLASQNLIKGVPSDRETAILKQSIPSITDDEDVAYEKLQKWKQAFSNKTAQRLNRIAQSNPESTANIFRNMAQGKIKIPTGWKLQQNQETGEYRLVRK